MEQIAWIIGPVHIYWSAVIRMLASAAAICLFLALYLRREDRAAGAAVCVPTAVIMAMLFSRVAHWYFLPDGYDNLKAALNLFQPGGFALMGAFAGCFTAALILRLLQIVKDLPDLLDCMCIGGSLGIAAGRLAGWFNGTDRGMIVAESIGLPWACTVINPVSGAEEYRLATFLIQAMAAAVICLALLLVWWTESRKGIYRSGDATLLFLLSYGASQVLLDSTRYDSLAFRSNGFIHVVQVLGAGAMVLMAVVYAGRLVYAQGWKGKQLLLWTPQLLCLGLAGYMEYYVQRHGDEAVFAYSTMGSALLGIVLLACMTRVLARRAEKKRRQQMFEMTDIWERGIP